MFSFSFFSSFFILNFVLYLSQRSKRSSGNSSASLFFSWRSSDSRSLFYLAYSRGSTCSIFLRLKRSRYEFVKLKRTLFLRKLFAVRDMRPDVSKKEVSAPLKSGVFSPNGDCCPRRSCPYVDSNMSSRFFRLVFKSKPSYIICNSPLILSNY